MDLKLKCSILYRKPLIGTFLLLCVSLFLCSCNKNKTEKELNDLYSSGVVLVQNSGYYELKIDDGLSVYFSNYSEEGELENFTFDKDSIIVSTSYGTGFFVSELGEIVTNHHVVGSSVTERAASKSLKKMFKAVKDECSTEFYEYRDLADKLNNVIDEYRNDYSRMGYITDEDYATYQRVVEYRDACNEKMEAYKALYNLIDEIDISDAELEYINSVSIAYNDEHITSSTDFEKCVVKKTDPDNDLAIIQLSNKKTPYDKMIFEIPLEDPMQTSSMFYPGKNDKLTMIGFNLGPALALTEEGILSQCTSGMISQERENCYMYSIPSLHGSSGAPVLNQKGELVAINFAGLSATQNFNYGIKVKYLSELYY